jgi:UDP-glucose 4-epimerase
VDATFTVAEAAVAHGVRKVVFSSTASVYGAAESFPTTERHHPWNNDTLYGAAKVFGEGLLRSFHATSGLDHVVLRYFNVYGPRMDVHGKYTEVLVRWMERIDAGLPPVVHGDGQQTMDFVHVADIARANLLAASADLTDDVVNIATGRETSLLELAEALVAAMDSDLAPEHAPARSVADVPRRLADVRAARDKLGWQARIGLPDGLRDLVQWWRADQRTTS